MFGPFKLSVNEGRGQCGLNAFVLLKFTFPPGPIGKYMVLRTILPRNCGAHVVIVPNDRLAALVARSATGSRDR